MRGMGSQELNQSPKLIWSVWKLLRLRLIISFNSFRRGSLRQKIGMAILGVIILGAVAAVFVGSLFLLNFLQSPALNQFVPNSQAFLTSVPMLVLNASFIGILFTSFGVLLQALYLASDMDLLLSLPLPMRAVFLAKLLQAILPNLGLIGMFSLPVLFGMGIANHYSFLYYPLVLILILLMALTAAGISSLLVMGIVRIFPARRVAEVLAFLGAIISIVCSQSGQFTNRINFDEAATNIIPSRLAALTNLNAPWSPLAWGGRVLVDIGEGRWLSGLLFLILFLSSASIVFVVCLQAAEQLYYSGWANMQTSPRKKKSQKSKPAISKRTSSRNIQLPGILPRTIRGIINKDYLVLRRDLRNLSQVITPMIFGIIYTFMLVQSGGEAPSGRGEAPAWFMDAMNNITIYANVGISLFVGWSLLSRLALMGFSQEGKYFWIIKAAPISGGKLITAKFTVAYLPSLCIGLLFLTVISLVQGAPLSVFLYGLPVIAFSLAGMAGINTALGIKGANFAWEDPRQMARGTTTGCLSPLISLPYMIVSLALFFGPSILLSILQIPVMIGQLVGLVAGGGVCLACAILPPLWMRKAADQLGEV